MKEGVLDIVSLEAKRMDTSSVVVQGSMEVKFSGASPSEAKTSGSAGYDLACSEDVCLEGLDAVLVKTGVSLEMPFGIYGLVYLRSGFATKNRVMMANHVGVIDSDYRGEIMVPLRNLGADPINIPAGTRIAQIIFSKMAPSYFIESSSLSETDRGDGGFGSTGQ